MTDDCRYETNDDAIIKCFDAFSSPPFGINKSKFPNVQFDILLIHYRHTCAVYLNIPNRGNRYDAVMMSTRMIIIVNQVVNNNSCKS